MRRLWPQFRELRTDLFEKGGLTIDSPSPCGEGDLLDLRTVIQADGDALWTVRAEVAEEEPAKLREHQAKVAAAYADTTRMVSDLRLLLTVLQGAAGAMLGLTGLVLSLGGAALDGTLPWWSWASLAGSLLSPLAGPVVRGLVGWRIRKGLGPGLL